MQWQLRSTCGISLGQDMAKPSASMTLLLSYISQDITGVTSAYTSPSCGKTFHVIRVILEATKQTLHQR